MRLITDTVLAGLVVTTGLLAAAPVFAQYGGARFGETRLPGPNCLSDAQRKTNAELKALTRPTTKDDPIWIFDPEYLVGTWTIDWNGPETPLGTEVTGTLTIAHVEGCDYEGTLDAKSLEGPYTAKLLIQADPDRQWLTWTEIDSRGFVTVRSGQVAGDLGGYFTHYWDRVAAFTLKGKKLRLFGSTFFASPGAFQLRAQLSVDGGPVRSMGTVWFRKGRTR